MSIRIDSIKGGLDVLLMRGKDRPNKMIVAGDFDDSRIVYNVDVALYMRCIECAQAIGSINTLLCHSCVSS